MTTPEEFEREITSHSWAKLRKLWGAVQAGDTPHWPSGKAFEYMVLRAFQLDGAEVRWPYSVSLLDEEVEQIDGSVRFGSHYALVESKDEAANIAIAPIAKIRNQLLRRPAGTIGMVFSSRQFTEPAILLTRFMLPQPILLWTGDEVDLALGERNPVYLSELKYRECVDSGLPDYNVARETLT